MTFDSVVVLCLIGLLLYIELWDWRRRRRGLAELEDRAMRAESERDLLLATISEYEHEDDAHGYMQGMPYTPRRPERGVAVKWARQK